MTAEQFDTRLKKVRGMSAASIALIGAMYSAAKAAYPITGRGIGYKLFTRGLIASMGRADMQRVYRLLKEARERGTIPWHWIVDESRKIERTASWDSPADFAESVGRQYRRDFWNQQPGRVEIWSEKGTIRGVVQPVLDGYGVGFRVMHGFSSATAIYDIARDSDGRHLTALYLGDWDPSGLFMSASDIPNRLKRYGGHHVQFRRIALAQHDLGKLPSFLASDKKKDKRHPWFVKNFGHRCWEIDAMDPNDLRTRVENEIVALIEPVAWNRCTVVDKAERESLQEVLTAWGRQ